MMYRPHTGAKHVQLFGASDFVTYSDSAGRISQQHIDQRVANAGLMVMGGMSFSHPTGGSISGMGLLNGGGDDEIFSDVDSSVRGKSKWDKSSSGNGGGAGGGGPAGRSAPGVGAQAMPEASVASLHTQMLFDLAIEGSSEEACGGVKQRRTCIETMRSTILKDCSQFLKEAEFDVTTVADTSTTSTGIHRQTEDTKKYKVMLPTGLLQILQPSKSTTLPPALAVPVTVLCARGPHILPWELLVTDVTVVRSLVFCSFPSDFVVFFLQFVQLLVSVFVL